MTSLFLLLGLWACSPDANHIEKTDPLPTPPTPEGGAVVYTLEFPEPHTHYFAVSATFPTLGAETLELYMPNWTPGSYKIRDYARHIEDLESSAPIERTSKNRWMAQTKGVDAIRIEYRLYAREMGVQTNFVDADLAMLNGAATFMTPVEQADRPHDVRVVLPEGWGDVAVALPPIPEVTDLDGNSFRAADFDTLVDSPIIAGNLTIYPFEVEGVPHALVNALEDEIWDGPQSAKDVQTITEIQAEFWGTIPYDQYLYLNVIGETRGGLEHKSSTLMLTSRWNSAEEDAYKGWLGLVSHEFFHTWNVKRLRPKALGPFDYEDEIYTPDLWIAEGFTSYYDDLMLLRAGLIEEADWLERMGNNIERIQTTPGRHVRSLSDNSRDAWFKLYNRDENTQNTSISYYTKGAVVAWLLDAKIRKETADTRSLDDVMRAAYGEFSGDTGYTSDEFRKLASNTAGIDLDSFFASTVDGTAELDYREALDFWGLTLPALDEDEDEDTPPSKEGEEEDEEEEEGWIGLNLGGSVVQTIQRGTPAEVAGFNVDDEVLAINGYRVSAGGWSRQMGRFHEGDEVEVLISRRGKLRTLTVTLEKDPGKSWSLSRKTKAETIQTKHFEAWMAR